MSGHIKTWDERMPKPRVEYRCTMNCSPSNPGRACGDCAPVKVYGDPIAARDAEIAELRAKLASRCRAEGGNTSDKSSELIGSAPAAGTDQDAERYKVVEGSQSAHCCFDFTVVDTTMPVMIHGEHYNGQFEAVCETFDREDAESIRDALNGARSIPEKLAAIQQNAEQKQTCPPARDEGNSAEVNYDRAQLQVLGQHEEKNG